MNVIFHIDELNKWQLTLGNVTNMVNYYQDNKVNYQIEVLANSEAVLAFQHNFDDKLKLQMSHLVKANVTFAACNNALKANHLSSKDIYDFITIVPSGVVELAQKQVNGFAYIKP